MTPERICGLIEILENIPGRTPISEVMQLYTNIMIEVLVGQNRKGTERLHKMIKKLKEVSFVSKEDWLGQGDFSNLEKPMRFFTDIMIEFLEGQLKGEQCK